jgi:hypothetical protein
LTLLACGLPLAAQSWDALRELKPGDAVGVLDTAGHERKGVFTAFSTDAISLQTAGGQVSIDRPRVRRVRVRSNARRARKALIGAAIGVAVGVTVDQTLGVRLRNEGNGSGRAVTYIAPIALFGGVGAVFPAYRTVYRAR